MSFHTLFMCSRVAWCGKLLLSFAIPRITSDCRIGPPAQIIVGLVFINMAIVKNSYIDKAL
jgi:hypothetical protein